MEAPRDEPFFLSDDTSTIASDLLTPGTEPSEGIPTDAFDPYDSDTWATESLMSGISKKEAPDSDLGSPLHQGFPSPRNRPFAFIHPKKNRKGRFGSKFFGALILGTLILGFVIFTAASWWTRSQGSSCEQPGADRIDRFIATQDHWIAVDDIVAEYDHLSEQIRSRETAMADMMLAVKQSNLPDSCSLQKEMQKFSAIADKAVDDLTDWTSLAAATLDQIQIMSNLTLFGYRSLQSMGPWTPAAGDEGLTSTFKHIFYDVCRREKHTKLQHLFNQEASKASRQLKQLKADGNSLAKEFGKMSNHLEKLATMAHNEVNQLQWDHGSIRWTIGNRMRLHKSAVKHFKAQAKELHYMAQRMMDGREMMKGARIKITRLNKGFEKLHLALAKGKWEDVYDIPWRLVPIQAAFNRLAGVGGSSRLGAANHKKKE